MTAFVIPGRCATKGSARTFVSKTGAVVYKHDNRNLAAWTKTAKLCALAAKVPMIYKPEGVRLRVVFQFVRPKSSKAISPTVRPDLDKCLRALLDALTGIAWADDSQVVHVTSVKQYGANERVSVEIEPAA